MSCYHAHIAPSGQHHAVSLPERRGAAGTHQGRPQPNPRQLRPATDLAHAAQRGRPCWQTLMHQQGIRARGKRRFKVTTDSNHDLPIAPNVLNRQFTVDAPDKVRVGDVTDIHTDEGWLFLAVVIDLFSRQVVGRCART